MNTSATPLSLSERLYTIQSDDEDTIRRGQTFIALCVAFIFVASLFLPVLVVTAKTLEPEEKLDLSANADALLFKTGLTARPLR